MLCVVAGVIERDGKVLIGQRPFGKSHPFEWEFPGGKMEPGETPEQALARELREELAIEAQIGREITRYHYSYRNKQALELIFFEVPEFEGEPQNKAFAQIAWVERSKLLTYSFLQGDRAFLNYWTRPDNAEPRPK